MFASGYVETQGETHENRSRVTDCYFSRVLPSLKEAPLAKLMKSVPSTEVKVTLRLDTGFMCGRTRPGACFFLQTAASAGSREAKDSGTSQSYTMG